MLTAADSLAPVMENRTAAVPSIWRSIHGLRKYRQLLLNLVLKDLKLKYRGSVIGFLWSLANPLVMLGVYTFAFTRIMRIDSPQFVFYLLLGLLSSGGLAVADLVPKELTEMLQGVVVLSVAAAGPWVARRFAAREVAA